MHPSVVVLLTCIINKFSKNRALSFNRDAINDLALHFLTKMKIMVLRDIERDEVEFICKVR